LTSDGLVLWNIFPLVQAQCSAVTGKVTQNLFEGSIAINPSGSIDLHVFSSRGLDAPEHPAWDAAVANSAVQPVSPATFGHFC